MEGFYRKKVGARALLAKKRERINFSSGHLFMGRGEEGTAWMSADRVLFLLWVGAGDGEGPHGTAQKIPDWLTKITFLVKSCIKPWLGVLGLSLGLVSWALAEVTPFWT